MADEVSNHQLVPKDKPNGREVNAATTVVDGAASAPRRAGGGIAARRVNILYAVLAAVASAAAGAWFAGSRIESPADVALRTAPPTPSPILVPVESRVLSSEIIVRGTARFGLPQPISLAPSTLKSGAGVITSLPLRNTQLREGDVILTASGRPVFLLQGQLPAYRDLVPGTSGDDVRQLKDALLRLGFDPGSAGELYDQRTSDAVAAFYKAKGWDPFGPTRDQIAAVRSLEREWADAVKAQVAATAAAATAGLAVEAARAAAVHNNRLAALESASRAGGGRTTPGSTGVPISVLSERAKAEHANTAADADLAAQIADQALVALDPRQTETARASADAKLEVARAARQKIRIEGEMAVQAAEREAALSADRAEVARASGQAARLEGERAVRAALDAQRLAALDAKMANERVDQLVADLALARRKIGNQMPIDEAVFVRTPPVRVEEVSATLGGAATGSLLTVTDNQLAVDSSLPLESAPLVRPGMPVTIDEQALGVKATGTVETVASTPGTRGVDGFHIYLGIRVDATPARLEGFSVRLRIPIESTKGAVLAVPVSALSLTTDGTSRVQAQTGAGLEYMLVRPGMSAGGYVEVAPVTGNLAAGQLVVVGYDNATGRDAK
jgi:peptidoglycan hydrolase-like protein with peptidoglycan-binding domain